jgi:hypothetical protein
MNGTRTRRIGIGGILLALMLGGALALHQAGLLRAAAPFGQAEDQRYAAELWAALERNQLIGEDAIFAMPYTASVHKQVLMTLGRTIEVDGHTGKVLVKKMYQGENISEEQVANNPDENLGIVAVMFQREAGYDPEHDDWFYARFDGEGKPTAPKGTPFVGRVPKCITCHQAAPGDDFIYSFDR